MEWNDGNHRHATVDAIALVALMAILRRGSRQVTLGVTVPLVATSDLFHGVPAAG